MACECGTAQLAPTPHPLISYYYIPRAAGLFTQGGEEEETEQSGKERGGSRIWAKRKGKKRKGKGYGQVCG
jgi:hypothetical protein